MTLPEEFISYTKKLLGKDRFDKLANGLQQELPVSIRINPMKCDISKLKIANTDGIVDWCSSGIYLAQRPNFTFDPLMHGGVYYVQEASSMFVDYVLRDLVRKPVTMLDLCAAPGGKSTACRAALPNGSLLISNEPIRARANILSENMQKQGHPDVIVTNNYPLEFRKAGISFDVILADVPCSGEGMFRKDPDAISLWSKHNVDNCSKLQREIIADIWPCLKSGGLLIYSTCTFNAHENEENAEWIAKELGADFMTIDTSADWNISQPFSNSCKGYRFFPGITRGEGLFMTVMRKHNKGKINEEKIKEQKRTNSKSKYKTGRTLTLPLVNAKTFDTLERGEKIVAIPKWWNNVYEHADKYLNIIHAGITIGTRKGHDIIPDQSLALSIMLDRDTFASCELDRDKAIAFLRKETVQMPEKTPKGFVLITHRGTPIGFAKNIGSRANNLYPQEWKIKSTHIPDENNIIIEKYETIS